MTRALRFLVGMLAVATLIAACSGGATSSPPGAGGSASPAPSGAASGPPSGAPSGSPQGGDGELPPPGIIESEHVEPQPGQQNVMPVPIEQFEASVDGRTVTLLIRWSSGVAPCSVLDQVLIDVGEETIDVTIREGTSDPDAMCVMILRAKHTIVSFDVEPGSYTIRDTQGMAPPVEITVP